MRNHSTILAGGATLLALCAGAAFAQNYPAKPIRIVTSGAGSGADIASRIIAQAIAGPLGQGVVVDNRASGTLPGQAVLQAPPDGYTILYEGSAFWLRPLMVDTSPYDALKDFQPITQSLRQPALLAVTPSLPVNSVKELIALARSKPGALNYATGSTGSLTHLAAELLQSMTDIKLERVAYKSGAQGVIDLMAGRVQLMFAAAPTLYPQVKAGKLKALGVTTAQPTDLVPGVPTIAASGVPGFESVSNVGLFATAKVARPIVNRLSQEISKALHSPEVKAKFNADGVETIGGTPEQFAAVIKAEITLMGKVIKERGIREGS